MRTTFKNTANIPTRLGLGETNQTGQEKKSVRRPHCRLTTHRASEHVAVSTLQLRIALNGTGEMAQWLGRLDALEEGPSLISQYAHGGS